MIPVSQIMGNLETFDLPRAECPSTEAKSSFTSKHHDSLHRTAQANTRLEIKEIQMRYLREHRDINCAILH